MPLPRASEPAAVRLAERGAVTQDEGTCQSRVLRREGGVESGGGSASMIARLAQIVFTVTQFPTVREVDIALDGADLV